MRKTLLAGAGVLALSAGMASAASHMNLDGQQLTVFGPWLGPDQEVVEQVLGAFAEQTGADVRYVGSDSFEQPIMGDAEAGSAPNVAVFPQPGLAADMARRGFLTPLADGTGDWVRDNYAAGQSWVDLGTYAGADGADHLYGFFYKVDVKSLVWYSPENFEDAGYEVPTTMEELKALTDQIVADGGTPWCIGLGSGGATGWPATDWVEELLLRTQTPDVYDGWVTNEIPFNDPRIVAAIDEFGYFARNDAYVAGGAGAVASTDFRASPKGLFSSPPQCYMHRQASFIPAFFPEGTVVGEDADFFYFPPFEANADLGRPVLGSGGLVSPFNDRAVTTAFIDFLQTPIAHEIMMAQGQFLTPHKDANLDIYTSDTQRQLGEILTTATSFRFDGSDLMPGEIGTNAFWTGMVDYTTGTDATTVANAIQERWDSIQ